MKQKSLNFFNNYHLGDNLYSFHFLLRYIIPQLPPNYSYNYFCPQRHHPILLDAFSDYLSPNLSLHCSSKICSISRSTDFPFFNLWLGSVKEELSPNSSIDSSYLFLFNKILSTLKLSPLKSFPIFPDLTPKAPFPVLPVSPPFILLINCTPLSGQWPLASTPYFSNLIKILKSKFPQFPVLCTNPQPDNPFITTTLRNISVISKLASLIVSVDSGPLHLTFNESNIFRSRYKKLNYIILNLNHHFTLPGTICCNDPREVTKTIRELKIS